MENDLSVFKSEVNVNYYVRMINNCALSHSNVSSYDCYTTGSFPNFSN